MRRRKKKTSGDLTGHFQKRCLERIGTELSQKTLKKLMAEHKLLFLGKQSHTRTLYIASVADYGPSLREDVIVVYDKPRHAFVTCMSYAAWKENHTPDGRRSDCGEESIDPDDAPIWA